MFVGAGQTLAHIRQADAAAFARHRAGCRRRRAGSMLYIRVDNPVDAESPPAASGTDKGNGIGLTNVRQRLAGAYKHEASIHWGFNENGFGVEIAMPAQTTEGGE